MILIFNKLELAKEIGNFFGDYFEQDNQFCIDNGLEVFRYDSVDLLLADWVDTLIENHHDTIDNPVSYFSPINNSWEKEILFIYSEVIGAYPRGVRPFENKDEQVWKASVDISDGSRHGRNLHLGTYSSIVDAIFARREFYTLTKDYFARFDLDKVIDIAREIREKAEMKRQAEKNYKRESEICAKYDLSIPESAAASVKSAQKLSQDNSLKHVYEAAWLSGYICGSQVLQKHQSFSLDDKIQAASARAAESHLTDGFPLKEPAPERKP